MAKTALIQRELKRDKLAAKYAKKYDELKAIATDAKKSEEERAAARMALQKLPRNANPTRQRNRCEITGRPRGTFRQFEVFCDEAERLGGTDKYPSPMTYLAMGTGF